VRTIKYISSNEMPEEQVIEIIEAEEPSKKIDEIEKSLKNDLTSEEKIKVLEVKIIQARKNILKWEGKDLQLTELIEGLIEVGVLPPSLSKKEIYERFKVFFDTDIDYTERKKTIKKRTNNLTPFIDELRDSVENWIKNKDE